MSYSEDYFDLQERLDREVQTEAREIIEALDSIKTERLLRELLDKVDRAEEARDNYITQLHVELDRLRIERVELLKRLKEKELFANLVRIPSAVKDTQKEENNEDR